MVFKDGCSVMSVYHHFIIYNFWWSMNIVPPTPIEAHTCTLLISIRISFIYPCYTHTHTYIHTYLRMYVRMQVRTFLHSFIHSCMHACIHAFMHSSAKYEGQFRVQYLVLGTAIECMDKWVMGCTSNWPIPCKINCCWKYARGRH